MTNQPNESKGRRTRTPSTPTGSEENIDSQQALDTIIPSESSGSSMEILNTSTQPESPSSPGEAKPPQQSSSKTLLLHLLH